MELTDLRGRKMEFREDNGALAFVETGMDVPDAVLVQVLKNRGALTGECDRLHRVSSASTDFR